MIKISTAGAVALILNASCAHSQEMFSSELPEDVDVRFARLSTICNTLKDGESVVDDYIEVTNYDSSNCNIYLRDGVMLTANCETKKFEECLRISIEEKFADKPGEVKVAGPPCDHGKFCTYYFDVYSRLDSHSKGARLCGFHVGGLAKLSSDGKLFYVPAITLKSICPGEV